MGKNQAWERASFVGREPERDLLRRLVDGAVAGRGGLAAIAGEPGIGKTRLTEEVATEAVSMGMRVFIGHCEERQGSPPYLPFAEILETAQRRLAVGDFQLVLGDAAGEMVKLLPGLRRSWLHPWHCRPSRNVATCSQTSPRSSSGLPALPR